VRGRVLWAAGSMLALLMALGFVLSRAPMGVAAVVGACLVPLMLVGPFLPFVWPMTVRVGSDGVVLEWLGRRRLVRFQDVASYEASAVRVRFLLRGGGEVAVVGDTATCAALSERLRPVLEHRALDVDALERRGRPVGEWISSLHAL